MYNLPFDTITTDEYGNRRLKTALNPELINGYESLLVESYVERNVKKGTQWEAAGYTPDATIEELLITTGSDFVIIKDFLIQVDGDGIQYQLFEAPELVASPTLTTVDIYNLRKDVLTSPQFTIQSLPEADVVSNGTPKTPLITILGTTGGGTAKSTPTSIVEGLERILAPNKVYLLRRNTLTPAQAQRSSFYGTFYEGGLSTDLEPAL